MTKKNSTEPDPEFVAMSAVHAALRNLEPDIQARVLKYVAEKLKLTAPSQRQETRFDENDSHEDETVAEATTGASADELEGVSPVAKKWLTRNGIKAKELETIFSIGGDEIDLISESVPGKKKIDIVHNVFLLKGVAAYLGSGAARVTHEQAKEACLHYDAYDATNFAKYIKSLSSDISGSKESGYTLTARGIANASKALKGMINAQSKK